MLSCLAASAAVLGQSTLVDQWARLRPGVRTYMRSTYDRAGGNEGADASHFLYQTGKFSVPLDIAGRGQLVFARFNHWHGSPWVFDADGKNRTIRESSSPPKRGKPEFQGDPNWKAPLALTWNETMGADVSWAPVSFQHSLRLGYENTHYGTGYYIYRLQTNPDRSEVSAKALQVLSRAGEDLTRGVRGLRAYRGQAFGGSIRILDTGSRPAEIRLLQLEAPRAEWQQLERARLIMRWDGRQASVNAPVALFFGAASLFNRDQKEYLVKSLPMNVIFHGKSIVLRCFFPMPFFRSAHMEVRSASPLHLKWLVKVGRLSQPEWQSAYFHATYRDFPHPPLGHDLPLLDTRGLEGARFWSGHFVGTSLIFSHNAVFTGLEGDPRFFFDDSNSPQCYGTGTEEWSCGGDYWGEKTTTLPLAGYPVGAPGPAVAYSADDKIESSYRFLLSDLMPFGRDARITFEHGGGDESLEHYESIAYWYGIPRCTLALTDQLDIGKQRSEALHAYGCTKASELYKIQSRYELGVDHFRGSEIFPAHTETGRVVGGISIFTIGVDPDNTGVLIRRKLDYKFADQRARVYIRKPGNPKWTFAGTWYLAGSNTCVYSNPSEELGAPQHVVETSNRRFREDEFLIPKPLTAGVRRLRVMIVNDPIERPLYPGGPILPQGWSEIRYRVYCFLP